MRIKSDGVDVKHILLACLMLLPASGALGATSGSLPMDANGNYGIGTTAPASKLDLVGVGTTSATSNLILRNANKSAIVTVLDNGNVGIGTTGPRAPLNTYAPPTSGFVRQIMVGGTGNYPSLDLGTYADYDGYISTYGNDLRILAGRGITTENHNIHFFTAFNGGAAENNERMIIQYNGNVGIGTAAPVAMLHVGVGVKSGTADLSSNSALIKGNLEVDGKIYGDGTGITGITGTISGLSAGYLPKASSGTTLANSSIYDNGTNVGVGVASPGAKLEVNGNLLVGGTGDTWFTGNVGIGSTAPASALDVKGSFAVYRAGKSASDTTAGETIIGVTDTSAPRTITLATADVKAGRIIIIKDESGGAATNNITIATQGTQLIDGDGTDTALKITVGYGVVRLYSDGTNWYTF